MRNLASVKRIRNIISPAPNSDSLCLLTIDGWQVVERIDANHKVGDLVVYFEIDSVFPEDREWAKWFIEKNIKRLRTVRLRSNVSQGVVQPLSILPEGTSYEEDQDVTELLGVTKYIPPMKFEQGDAKGDFPRHIIQETDETRIQNVPQVTEDFHGQPYYISTKMDGTSVTILYMDCDPESWDAETGSFEVCSRRNRRKESEGSVYWKVANKYDLRNKLKAVPWIVLQAEVCGPSIQSNRLSLTDHDVFVFNVYDQRAHRYLDFSEMVDMCKFLGVPTVPIIEVGDCFNYDYDTLFKMADGKYEGTDNWREGIVIRLQKETWNQKLGRSSFKVISHTYDLEKNKNRPDDE